MGACHGWNGTGAGGMVVGIEGGCRVTWFHVTEALQGRRGIRAGSSRVRSDAGQRLVLYPTYLLELSCCALLLSPELYDL